MKASLVQHCRIGPIVAGHLSTIEKYYRWNTKLRALLSVRSNVALRLYFKFLVQPTTSNFRFPSVLDRLKSSLHSHIVASFAFASSLSTALRSIPILFANRCLTRLSNRIFSSSCLIRARSIVQNGGSISLRAGLHRPPSSSRHAGSQRFGWPEWWWRNLEHTLPGPCIQTLHQRHWIFPRRIYLKCRWLRR